MLTTPDSLNKRILNEMQAKVLNEEKSDTVKDMRKGTSTSSHADMEFGCECDIQDCKERISMSTQEYAHAHQKNLHFIVMPDHVRTDIEQVISRFNNYCVVSKLFPREKTA